VYVRFLRPYLLNAQGDIDVQANKLKAKINEFTGDASKTE
jgi:receptor expression-enhancing protein 5/6